MEHSGDGWAEASLVRSLRRIALSGVIGCQLVEAAVAIPYGLGLALAQLALALIAWGALWATNRGIIGSVAAVVPVLMVALGAASYLVSGDLDSALTLAACWQLNFATCVAPLIVMRNHVIVWMVACAAVVSALLLWQLPGWGPQLPLSIIVTQLAIAVALRAGTAAVAALARRADHDFAEAERLARRERVARRVNAQVAEESRVLHDTAVNTLGAIAAGSWRSEDLDRIRDQCERDVVLLQDLHSHREGGRPTQLADLFDQQRLPIDRCGLDDDALATWQEQLDPVTSAALVGCVREAVTNAYKHAGVDRVQIRTQLVTGQLQVSVSDAGSGFDPGSVRLRGITSSIVERGQDAGIDVRIDSRPGQGTTITLTVGAPDVAPVLGEVTGGTVDQVTGRAAALWGIGVTIVGLVLTLTGGTNEHHALWPMMAMMLLACGVPLVIRHRQAAALVLIVLTVVIFVLSSAATGFGTVGISHWQALAATSASITLLAVRPGRRLIILGALVWGGAVLALAVTAQTPTDRGQSARRGGRDRALGGLDRFPTSR